MKTQTQNKKRKIITHLIQVTLTLVSLLGVSGPTLAFDLDDFNLPTGRRRPGDIQDGSSNTITNPNRDLQDSICEILRRGGVNRNFPDFPGAPDRPDLARFNCPEPDPQEETPPVTAPPADPSVGNQQEEIPTPPSAEPEIAAVVPQAATGGCSMMVGGSGIPWSWASLITMIPLWGLRRWKKKK